MKKQIVLIAMLTFILGASFPMLQAEEKGPDHPYECIEAYGKKKCGYGCLEAYGKIQCAIKKEHRCVESYGKIRCGLHCTESYGKITCAGE